MPTKITRIVNRNVLRAFVTFLALSLATPAIAAAPPSMDRMLAEADGWFLEAGAKYAGPPGELVAKIVEGDAPSAMLRIYSRNWSAVKSHADRLLNDLPEMDAKNFGTPRSEVSLEHFASTEITRFTKNEGILLAMRFFDPEVLGNAGYALMTASQAPLEDITRNTLIATFMTHKTFRTTLNDAPAIGVSRGFWTVITAYNRSEHGLFILTKIALFKRTKED